MKGLEIYELAKRLYPIRTSLAGEGTREFLRVIKEYIPAMEIRCVRSNSKCFDWTVPPEWHLEEAYIEELPSGRRVVDTKWHNLHVVMYSVAVDKVMSFEELKNHLYYREDLPDAIPYVTSYYHPHWGFCLTYKQFLSMNPESKYRVVIKSKHIQGCLNYGELIVRGETDKEVLFSTYICHPSMGNNELSGPALTTFLAKYVMEKPRKLTYRFVFVPETIGSICYISKHLEELKEKTIAGFVVTCVGDEGRFSFIPSRHGNTLADRVALNLLKYEVGNFRAYSFLDRGSDERQYNWPGVDLPVASVTKTKYGEYKEYHTSLDDLNFINPSGLNQSYEFYTKIIDVLEHNAKYKSTTLCEPHMSKRGLYHTISHVNYSKSVKIMMDFMTYADGYKDLVEIADTIMVSAYSLIEVANTLKKEGLIA